MSPNFRNLFKTGLMALAFVSLSACWQSEKSLILPQDSVNPLPMGIYEYYSGESTEDPDEVKLIPFPGGGYIYIDEDSEAMPLLVHRIDGDWHILQFGNDTGNLYGIAHKVGDKILVYDPDCEDDLEGILGLTISGSNCNFSSLEALVEATKAAAPHIAAGEHGPPNGWFKPQEYEPMN